MSKNKRHMSHLSTAQLAELARITKRQAQRILERGTPNLGASQTPGGHWIIPDTPAVRKWARHHQKWKRGGSAKKSSLNADDKSVAIVTIEGIGQQFALWQRKTADAVPRWSERQISAAIALLEPQARLYSELVARRDALEHRK
jgi:hypothetical protein